MNLFGPSGWENHHELPYAARLVSRPLKLLVNLAKEESGGWLGCGSPCGYWASPSGNYLKIMKKL
jgi:hypothetical protein